MKNMIIMIVQVFYKYFILETHIYREQDIADYKKLTTKSSFSTKSYSSAPDEDLCGKNIVSCLFCSATIDKFL